MERQERRDPFCSEILEWLQDFRENLVDDRDPEHRDSHTSSSHEPSLEPPPARSADLGKHSVYTHFPTDRYCEICQRTESTRAPCRRRIGAVLRAENFWWLDYSRSQSSQRRLWISKQSSICNRGAGLGHPMNPVEAKTSQKTQRSLQKFLEPDRKPRVIYTDNSLEFGKACEEFSWNHCTSTPHRSETNGIGERAVRRIKAPLPYCCNQVWMKIGGQIPWNVIPFCETFKISCLMGKLHTKDVLENLFRDQSFRLVHWLSLPYLCERPVKNPSIWKESLARYIPSIRTIRAVNLEGWRTGCRPWGIGDDVRIGNLL